MEQQKLDQHKQLLLQEKERVQGQINIINQGLEVSEQESTGELSQYDNHSGDSASTMYDREKDLGIKDNEKVILSKIEEALEKIEAGTYGRCSRCDHEIDPDRLAALPYATQCLTCQESGEHGDDRVVRPMEEEFLDRPFARTFNDNRDYTGFDGEDAWQAVARYNKLPHEPEYMGSTDENSDDIGYVQDVDKISNKQYIDQLE